MMTELVVQPSWLLVFRQAGSLHHNAGTEPDPMENH
jgi:hypothetical protein